MSNIAVMTVHRWPELVMRLRIAICRVVQMNVEANVPIPPVCEVGSDGTVFPSLHF